MSRNSLCLMFCVLLCISAVALPKVVRRTGKVQFCKKIDEEQNAVGVITNVPKYTQFYAVCVMNDDCGTDLVNFELYRVGATEQSVGRQIVNTKTHWTTLTSGLPFSCAQPGRYRVYVCDGRKEAGSPPNSYFATSDIEVK